MRKYLKIIVPIICVLVVAVTFFMIFDISRKVEKQNYSTENITDSENVADNENTTNTTSVDTDENTVTDNTTSSNEVEDEIVSNEDDKLSSSKQESAIEIMEEYWGEDNSVYFTNEGVDNNGNYIVAVRQKTSTTVKDYYKINIKTKAVEIYY